MTTSMMMRHLRLLSKVRFHVYNCIEILKFAADASNGLSCEKMLYHLDKTHPRVMIRDKKSKLSIQSLKYSWKTQIREAPSGGDQDRVGLVYLYN